MDEPLPFQLTASDQLGGYREWRLSSPALSFVDAAWIYHTGADPQPHRVLPDACPSLIIRIVRNAVGDATDTGLWVVGGDIKASWYRPRPFETMIGLRVKPEQAAGTLDLFPPDYRQNRLPAPEKLARHMRRLVDMAHAHDPMDVLRRLCLDAAAYARDADARSEQYLAGIIRRSCGQAVIRDLVKELGFSERTVRRRFRDATGVSPKAYARMARLNALTLAADRLIKPDWAGLAAEFQYFDQSHLIRECLAFAGITPARLHAERREEAEISNILAA